MLDYLYANNYMSAFSALKADAATEYTPDPKAKYTGLLEKKWTSVIRLQKKVRVHSAHICTPSHSLYFSFTQILTRLLDHGFRKSQRCTARRAVDITS